MTQSEKEMILVKLQELTNIINGITCKEATLFEQDEQEINQVTETPAQEKPKRSRVRFKDGTMTAATIAHALSKELRRTITKESVVRVAKNIKLKPTYCQSQHTSRYPADAVQTIMNLYRSLN